MVGIVVVSHSEELANGVVTLAREMAGEELALESAGGIEAPGVLGTDANRVRGAIERAMSEDGVLVLMDLGSALMSAEFAIEMLADGAGPVRLSEAPLVEGTMAAAVAAGGGATLEEVAAQARGALAVKASQLGTGDGPAADAADPPADTEMRAHAADAPAAVAGKETDPVGPPDAQATLVIRNEPGLHARPAARLIELARSFDADVRVARADGEPVSARSLTNVVALGARLGDELKVTATGPEARAAIEALRSLADDGFGDRISARPPAPAAPAPGRPAAASVPVPSAGEVFTGVSASPGLAVGAARHLHGATGPPPESQAESPEREHERLQQGLQSARRAIADHRTAVAGRAGEAVAEIFDVHLALLDDEAILGPAGEAIDAGATAEHAWHDAAERVAARYRTLPDPLLSERATDVLDIGRRVVEALQGKRDSTFGQAGIVIVGELTPADAAALDPALVGGIAAAHGAVTAHAAILARALGLPAVVGLGAGVLAIDEGTPVLLDADAATLQVQPPDGALRDAERRRERGARRRAAAREGAREPGATRDGAPVQVFANLGSAGEAARAVELGAEGVGLLRTEFLFLDRAELPDEEEQAETLRQAARRLDGRPLVVRTLDAGADKPLPALQMPAEANPFLGVRGIRLALQRRDVLATQFRAILRVAAEHPIKAMLPMVATLQEVREARAVLAQARAETGIAAALQLGIMVEVPAAALIATRLAEHVDFFSLGTNDLTQYTMAADRGDERLASLLAGPQPAVLRLVQATVEAAASRGLTVGVCGELAGDPAAAVLLVGLGVTELSMAPALIAEAKAALRGVDLTQARTAAQAALAAPDADAARALGARLL